MLFPLGYKDFDKSEYPFHTLSGFNWEDHAFSVLNKYDQAGAKCINRLSEFAFEMTNGYYGD